RVGRDEGVAVARPVRLTVTASDVRVVAFRWSSSARGTSPRIETSVAPRVPLLLREFVETSYPHSVEHTFECGRIGHAPNRRFPRRNGDRSRGAAQGFGDARGSVGSRVAGSSKVADGYHPAARSQRGRRRG